MSQSGARRSGWKLSIETWVALVALVPVPAWFFVHVGLDAGPAWRATYFAGSAFDGLTAVALERELSHYWDTQHSTTPGGFDARSSSAAFETCLELQMPLEAPVLLVGNGIARLLIDGVEQLSGADEKERWVRSKLLALAPGVHHVRVEFSARNWPSIGLLASLDGHAPVALASGRLSRGVSTRLPSDDAAAPCAPD